MRENVYINKLSDTKYELVTKDIGFEPGVYTLHAIEKNLFVIKKQFYKTNYADVPQQSQTSQTSASLKSEDSKLSQGVQNSKQSVQNPIQGATNESLPHNVKSTSEKEAISTPTVKEYPVNNKDEETISNVDKNSTQEWYKKALELKTRLVQEQFLSLSDVEEVRKISYVTRQDINSGEILGIRGFDKNYYIFKKVLFDKMKDMLLGLMDKEPMDIEDILDKVQYPKEQILGIIEILKEQSDLIEVKKGIFRKV